MRVILTLILSLLLIVPALADIPIVLLFPVTAGSGADPALAGAGTDALKLYMRETGKAEVVEFDPESVMVRRALMEHRIKPDDIVSVTSPEARLRMGKLLFTDMVMTGDILVKDDVVTVSVWLGDVKTNRVSRMDAESPISKSGARDRAVANSMQSAASTVVIQLAGQALKDVKEEIPASIPTDPIQSIHPVPSPILEDPGDYIAKADEFVKSGDIANAIMSCISAINLDPTNIDYRLKLAGLYADREMFTQAIDELKRAEEFGERMDSLRAEQARIYERMGASDKAVQVFIEMAERNPNDINARITAGDYLLKRNATDEAEKQYRLAAQADASSHLPHERLALLFAAQSLFAESRKEVELFQRMDKVSNLKTASERYLNLRASADRDIIALIALYDSGKASFESRRITREYYYETVRGIDSRAGSIARFLEVLTPPEGESAGHTRRILVCSLLSQACANLENFLETNKTESRDIASMFVNEARKLLQEVTAGN